MKVILITGASSGIGKEAAIRLIKDGYIVYGAARRLNKMQDLKESGGNVLEMDITDKESIKKGVKKIMKEQGRIDVLLNNAGYGLYGAVEDIEIDVARHQFEVNLFGLAELTREILPIMRNQKSGLIINMSSMGGQMYTPLGAWYHATKHALEGWSDCLRLEVKQFGINVVIIQPGLITTEFGDVLVKPILEHSGKGPYGKMASSVAEGANDIYKKGGSSPASEVADLISEVIRKRNPKTRYTVGKLAKPMIILRKWFWDRLFDRILLKRLD